MDTQQETLRRRRHGHRRARLNARGKHLTNCVRGALAVGAVAPSCWPWWVGWTPVWVEPAKVKAASS
eukprot:354903-Chlamydomonas_euryale.AAC.9